MRPITFATIFMFGLFSPPAFSQEDIETDYSSGGEIEDSVSTLARKAKKRKRSAKSNSHLFPDWPTPSFGWGLSPVLGFRYRSVTTKEGGTKDETTSEIGGMGHLRGIPLIPGNAGWYIEPDVGYVLGRVDLLDAEEGQLEDYTYKRGWAGVDNQILLGFYKHTLGINRGSKIFEKGFADRIDTLRLKNDFGFLILPFFSSHYTNKYLWLYQGGWGETPSLTENDNWVHGRLFTGFMSFFLDVGPGVTFLEEDLDLVTNRARTDYVLAKSQLIPFWKLTLMARAKYYFNSTGDEFGSYASANIPDEGLHDPPDLGAPEDSMSVSTLVGLPNLFLGLGIGWRYNLLVLNLSKKHNRERETYKNHGFVVTFSLSL